jgi:hypothetical protein
MPDCRFCASWANLRLFVQQHIQQRSADPDVAVVLDKSELPKLVHEEIDVSAAGADHFGERFLIDLGYDRIRPLFLAIIRQDQQKSRQTLFGRVEQLINQVLLHPNVAFHQIRGEELGELMIVVQRAHGGRLRHLHEPAFGQSLDGRDAQLVSGEAFFAAEAAGEENCNHSPLSLLGYYRHLDLAGLNIKDAVRRLALGIDDLIPLISGFRLSAVQLGDDGFRIRCARFILIHDKIGPWIACFKAP